MTPRECMCGEESVGNNSYDNVLRSISLSDFNDYIQEVLHIKCKVVQLAREQISKLTQNQVSKY